MVGVEKRAALGIQIIGSQGSGVIATLYVERGSGYVPLHEVPTPDGKIKRLGFSKPHQGISGPEIEWATDIVPRAEAGQLFESYIRDNGWKGSSEVLDRLALLH